MRLRPIWHGSERTPDAFEHYAQIYDGLKGSRTETIAHIKKLIAVYCPYAHSLLELACGTGSILEGFADGPYELVGLDNSPAMLKLARQKLPGVDFVQADMTNFSLGRKFDAICCVHNSVNHLLSFDQWLKLFRAARRHLHEGGVFIFDMSTREKLDEMAGLRPTVYEVGENLAVIRVLKGASPERYQWEHRIFLHEKGNQFRRYVDRFDAAAYPVSQVTEALEREFVVKKVLRLDGRVNFDDKNRVYFVCVKRL